MIKRFVTAGLFAFLLLSSSLSVRASYDGILLQKNQFGIYEVPEVEDTTYILEYPCENIDSIKFRFPKELLGKEIKISGANLDGNPTRIDIPGLEYKYCNITIMVNNEPMFDISPTGEVSEDLSYLMTVDYSVDKVWINENEIDEDRINLFTFLKNQKTWQDLPGAELVETEKEFSFTSTSEDDRSNFTLVTTGNVPEQSLLHRTGKSANLALIVTLLLSTLIYFLPKWALP